MRQFDCPQCAAPVPFETPGAVFAVCQYCQSMVVRRDADVETIGTMAELPPEHTPLQVGARGTHQGRSFKLLGRLRMSWGDGSWNEWYADFGNGKHGWVADAQGFFQISEAQASSPDLSAQMANIRAVKSYKIDGDIYQLSDTKRAIVIAGEGELPFVAQPHDQWTSFDLTGPGRKFASLEDDDGEARLYTGVFAQPEEITWEGLRAVPGWRGEPVPVEKKNTDAIPCPACGGVITLRAAGQTQTLACSHCGTLLDTQGAKAKVAQKIEKSKSLAAPVLPLGKRGTLRGVEWEIIGCQMLRDKYASWNEVLLYNPWSGFAWLTEFQGHWNLIKRVVEAPDAQAPAFNGQRYKLFSREEATVIRVAGEFYWRIRIGDKAIVSDFIAPPRVLSSEKYQDELTWSEGAYLDAKEIEQAFKLEKLPPATGEFLNQPNPYAERYKVVRRYAWLAFIAMIVMQAIALRGPGVKTALEKDFTYVKPQAGAPAAPLISPSFDLTGSQSPAQIEASANVDNQWLGLNAELIDEKTGQRYPADVLVQYYHGYDDGAWSEGSQHAKKDVPAVPPGRYHLAITPETDASIPKADFHIKLKHGGVFWSNFILCTLAIWIWPIWTKLRSGMFEAKRWQQSDFTP